MYGIYGAWLCARSGVAVRERRGPQVDHYSSIAMAFARGFVVEGSLSICYRSSLFGCALETLVALLPSQDGRDTNDNNVE